jgi:hypothetical protein
MILFKRIPGTDVLEILVDGGIGEKELHEAVRECEAIIEERGSLSILKEIRSIGGIAPKALWEDIRFAMKHLKHIRRGAVLSDKKWVDVWTKLANPFFSAEVRFFEPGQRVEALEWLCAPSPTAATTEPAV